MTQAWPKGKMIEGRSGGSGRGTRRELWAQPDSGSAHPTDRRFVSCTDSRPESFTAPPFAFPSLRRFLTRRTCLLATGKNSAAPKRTFSSALVSAEWRAQRENDRRKERGILAGRSKKNCGPHLTAVLLTDGSQVCIVYRLSTRVVPCAAPRI